MIESSATMIASPFPATIATGDDSKKQPGNSSYFSALDGYRSVAFLVVFATHYLGLPWGLTGVDAFFVLSGFLITGILFDTRNKEHRARNFYIRRTLRIFPLYYGVILALVLVYPIFRWDWNWTWLAWPAYAGNFGAYFHPAAPGSPLLTMVYAQLHSQTFPKVLLFLGHFWSLCVEEQFYLFWPWIVFLIKDRVKLIYICASSIFLCTAMRVFAHDYLPQFMIDAGVTGKATPMRLDALLIGGMIALIWRGPRRNLLLPLARIGAAVVLVAFIGWHILHRADWVSYPAYRYPSWAFTWGFTFSEIFYASLIVLTIHSNTFAFRAFNIKPLRWLGRISYGAYVFHDIFHTQYLRLGYHFGGGLNATIATAAIGLLSTLLISWASYRWFESPFIRLKDRWTV